MDKDTLLDFLGQYDEDLYAELMNTDDVEGFIAKHTAELQSFPGYAEIEKPQFRLCLHRTSRRDFKGSISRIGVKGSWKGKYGRLWAVIVGYYSSNKVTLDL